MTAYHTTPSVWFAARSAAASQALIDRTAPFCDAHELLNLTAERARVMHDVGTHAVAMLVVDSEAEPLDAYCELAWKCSELNPWFRCIVVGDGGECDWPKPTIFLPAATLSSVLIDRIRLEAHALRIAANRQRHVVRLQTRGAK